MRLVSGSWLGVGCTESNGVVGGGVLLDSGSVAIGAEAGKDNALAPDLRQINAWRTTSLEKDNRSLPPLRFKSFSHRKAARRDRKLAMIEHVL